MRESRADAAVTDAAAALQRASELLARRIGLRVEGAMRSRVRRAVRDGAEARGTTPGEYVAGLLGDDAALQALVDAITVQQSGFFRDSRHFDVLVRRALPTLPGPGIVWSAGCGNGQEPWSLAIALEEAGAADWRVLATDISSTALARAEAGHYTEREIAGLSPARLGGFLTRTRDGTWEVGARLRRRVTFLPHNVAEDPPPLEAGACRVVFCRNVFIYLGPDATARALRALRERMPADGWLFIGAAEALTAEARLYAPQLVEGVYVYRPRTGRRARGGRGPAARGDGVAMHDGVARAPAAPDAGRASATPAGAAGAVPGPPLPAPPTGAAPPGAGGRAPDPRLAARPPGDAPAAAGAPALPARPRRGAPARPGDGAPPLPEPAALVAEGEAHVAAGRFAEAVTVFRKASFLAPDDPLPLLGLGLALERDDGAAARRAFRAARAALARAGDDAGPGGWTGAELARLLDAKLAREE